VARPRGFSRGPRRSSPSGKEWGFGPGGGVPALITSGKIVVGAGVQPTVTKLTILRLRGEILVAVNSLGSATDNVSLFLGMGIFSTDAFSVGQTALPGPTTDIFFPWLWWNVVHISPQVSTLGLDGVTSIRIPVDAKAMRKFGTDQVVGLVAEYASQSGAVGCDIQSDARMLVQWAS